MQIGGYPTLRLYFNGAEQETYRGEAGQSLSESACGAWSMLMAAFLLAALSFTAHVLLELVNAPAMV